MRKQTFVLFFFALLISNSISAQNATLRNDTIYADADTPSISTKVSMEIDPSLFPNKQGSIFFCDTPRAMIMPMVIRANFDSLNQERLVAETATELNLAIEKSGRIQKKGKDIYFISGYTKDKERSIVLEVYFIKYDLHRTIMITGFYDKVAKKKYKKQIQRAALTATIEQKHYQQ